MQKHGVYLDADELDQLFKKMKLRWAQGNVSPDVHGDTKQLLSSF